MEVNYFDNLLPTGTVLKGSSYSYRIEKTLGQGSFGITYLASVKMAGALGAIDANIKVAIKEFFMRDINGRSDTTVTSGSKGGIYDEYKRKFTREALNLSKLQHPNIIKVIESFEANNTIYYVMEYIGGGSLDDYIAKNNGLKEDEAIRIIKQIGNALSFMHDNKMIHLDLKPSNIMMKESGDVVLIDFGLSKQYDSNGEPESSTKVGAGTPGYAPIEQANYREGKGFPVTMDVYALGATMFKMLTGVRPPEASDILNDGFPLYELQERKVNDTLSACIAKAMATTKRDRFQSVNDFIEAIESNGEGTIIDVDVVAKKDEKRKNKTEKVFVVHSDTSKVTFEYTPQSPILHGAYYASVSKDGHVDTNVTQESTHNVAQLSNVEYEDFLRKVQSLNLVIRDNEVPYNPHEYSESPAKLRIKLYDANGIVYNDLWISGWKNDQGNIIGSLREIESSVRAIVPQLQAYIDGPMYEYPNIPDYIVKEKHRKENTDVNKVNAPIQNVKKSRRYIFLFALLVLVGLIAILSKNFLPLHKDNIMSDTVHTQTDSIIDSIRHSDEESVTGSNLTLSHEDMQSAPANKPISSKERQNVNSPKDDESKFQEAVSSNNITVIKELAVKGYAKAYSKVANIYLKEGKYSYADSYARRALSSGYGKNEAINVIEILDGYGYYDNGEHGGKPKY